MTKKETINRNIGLTFDLLRQAVKDPSILNKLSDGSILEFVEKDFRRKKKQVLKRKKPKRRYLLVKSELEVV